MYQGKMAFAVKVDGKILRERGEAVFLPFGSEYTLLVKNLNNRRACVRITLDGQEVVDGGLIVNANSSVDLERFVKPGQLEKGNRFKFIERTGKVEATRGIGLEDGILRVEFEFEKEVPKYIPPVQHIYHHYNHYPLYRGFSIGDSIFYGSASAASISGSTSGSLSSNATMDSYSAPEVKLRSKSIGGEEFTSEVKTSSGIVQGQNMAGITVPGSVSEQKFTTVNFTGDGTTDVMIIRLFGETADAPVKAPVTVKTKQKCTTCRHVNKATAKFCSECGTGLEIV